MKTPLLSQAGRRCPRTAGFTLIELLVTMVIMATMAGLLAVAIPGFRSSYERRHAVNQVVGTLERARVAALQGGENVYVIFARPTDASMADDAMIVVGEPPLGSATTDKIFYTPWIHLAKGMRFRGANDTLVVKGMPSEVAPSMLPFLDGKPLYSGITFNSTGQVEFPAGGGLTMALFEGTRLGTDRATGASAAATKGLADSGLYDVIHIARYSGRASVNMETLQYK